MGVDRFWLQLAAAATVGSGSLVPFNQGTHPAGYAPALRSTESAYMRAYTGSGTIMTFGAGLVVADTSGVLVPLRHPFDEVDNKFDAVPPPFADPPIEAAGPETATPQAKLLEEIRALTDMSWPQIAKLIGVQRQTVFRWRTGNRADDELLNRAISARDVLNEARYQHGEGADLRQWLYRRAPLQQASPAELIAQDRIDEAMFLAMLAPSKVTSISEQARDTSQWDRFIAEEERSYQD